MFQYNYYRNMQELYDNVLIIYWQSQFDWHEHNTMSRVARLQYPPEWWYPLKLRKAQHFFLKHNFEFVEGNMQRSTYIW